MVCLRSVSFPWERSLSAGRALCQRRRPEQTPSMVSVVSRGVFDRYKDFNCPLSACGRNTLASRDAVLLSPPPSSREDFLSGIDNGRAGLSGDNPGWNGSAKLAVFQRHPERFEGNIETPSPNDDRG